MINALPQSIIETILCLIPIEEAARTSILSREWRYKWTTIPKLVFSELSVTKITSEEDEWIYYPDSGSKLFSAVLQVLSLRQGPIHEFTLRRDVNGPHDSEIDQIILQLSKNHTVKKLTLNLCLYKLPLRAYSWHQLTELYLDSVEIFDQKPIFDGFCSLGTLCLRYVDISAQALLHILSNCPSLTSLTLRTLDTFSFKKCTIIELFECLPVIERLSITGWTLRGWLVLDKLPASLIHLKYFRLEETWFVDDLLRFLLALIKCSPNLEKIRLEIDLFKNYYDDDDDTMIYSGILEEYSDVRLPHLNEVVINYFRNIKPEMELVKFILARSPNIKKVRILSMVTKEENLEILETLLRAPHPSPVEFVVSSLVYS